jgi:hypothetical protein
LFALPDVRFDSEEEVKSQEGCHHHDVAGDAHHVADLVRHQEELVDEPEKKKNIFIKFQNAILIYF